MSAVFVSYSHRDHDRVIDIVNHLKASQVDVWWDEDLPAGKTWDDQIEAALERASTVIIVWSEDAVASENVKDEAHYAREENKALSVRIENVTPPFRYRRLQAVDLFKSPVDANQDWRSLLTAVSAGLGVSPSQSSSGENEQPSGNERIGIAISWRAMLPAVLVALSLVINITSTIAFEGDNTVATALSWGVGGAALAFAIANLMSQKGHR